MEKICAHEILWIFPFNTYNFARYIDLKIPQKDTEFQILTFLYGAFFGLRATPTKFEQNQKNLVKSIYGFGRE